MPYVKDGVFHSYLNVLGTTKSIGEALSLATNTIEGSEAFIFERTTDHILITSKPETKVSSSLENGEVLRYTTETFDMALVNDVGRKLKAMYGKDYSRLIPDLMDFESGESIDFQVTSEGVSYFVNVGLKMEFGMEWVIVVAIPQSYFLSSIMIIIGIVISLAASLLVLTVLISFLYGMLVSQPFFTLKKDMVKVEQMRLDDIKKSKSMFDEVASLQTYFNSLVEKMKIYRTFLPQHLLASLDEKFNGGNDRDAIGSNTEKAHAEIESRQSRSSMDSSGIRIDRSTNVLHLGIGLESREATVLLVTLQNFEELLSDLMFTQEEVVVLYGEVLAIVQRVTHSNKGEVVNFGGREMTSVWHGRNQDRLCAQATLAATQIMDQVSQLNTQSHKIIKKRSTISLCDSDENQDNLGVLHARLGITITCGIVFMGYIGTRTLRNYVISGDALHRAENISRLHDFYSSEIIIDNEVMQQISKTHVVRPLINPGNINSKNLIGLDAAERIVIYEELQKLVGNKEALTAFELGPSKKVNMDEWMYELEQKKKLSQWDQYIDSIKELVFHSDIAKAHSVMEEYIHQYETDSVAKVVKNILKIGLGLEEPSIDEENERQGIPDNVDPVSIINDDIEDDQGKYHHPDASTAIDITFQKRTTQDKNEDIGDYHHPDMIEK